MLVACLLAVASLSAAQTILPSTPDATFPACALSCTSLLNAQTVCVPPSAPVTDQFVYDQCFCSSAYLATLYSTPDGVCDAECPVESDRQLLQTWYEGFCAQVAQTLLPTEAGATSTSVISSSDISTSTTLEPATSSTEAFTVTATQVTDSGATIIIPPSTLVTSPSGSAQSVVVITVTSTESAPLVSSAPTSGAIANSASSGPWIKDHWQWILMLGILIVGFALLAWLAVCLKRRHRRKKEAQAAAASGFPKHDEKRTGRSSAMLEEMFGPHQHQAMTQGFEYTHDQNRALGAVSAVGAAIRERSRQRKRDKSARRDKSAKRGDPNALTAAVKATELDATRDALSRPASRQSNRDVQSRPESRKGKRGRLNKAVEMDSGRYTPSQGSRSRRTDPEKTYRGVEKTSRRANEKDVERDVDAIEEG